MSAPAIALKGICKTFGAVRANDNVDLTVGAGTVHGIIGENGAGKSTLVSILSGHYKADAGSITLFGEAAKLTSSADAIGKGIGMVHQHFMMVPNFSVLDNLALGMPSGMSLKAGRTALREQFADITARYDLAVDPDAIVEELPVGLQQRVEIVKALMRGGRILILDEPTGVLTPAETDRLFESVAALKAQGVTILLITHKLREIMAITDNVSVMRGGKMVAHRETANTTREELAELMVGRSVRHVRNSSAAGAGPVVMEAHGLGLTAPDGTARLADIDFTLRAGEIVGVAGVAGNGQSELLAVLSGMTAPSTGVLKIGDQTITPSTPADPGTMRGLGIAHVPEDRRREGLVLPFQMQENAVLGYLRFAHGGRSWLLGRHNMLRRCADLMSEFDVRPPNPRLRAEGFSGGNQQKLVIAREHGAAPKVLLVGQPTRGVDIGAIEFIHRQLIQLKDEGCAVLLVSVELDEILALSDRVIAMNAGRIVGEVAGDAADRQAIGLMMAGVLARSGAQSAA
ncbi:MAG: ABC transporter ATP-binding protein [Pseudomonadota bacterium]